MFRAVHWAIVSFYFIQLSLGNGGSRTSQEDLVSRSPFHRSKSRYSKQKPFESEIHMQGNSISKSSTTNKNWTHGDISELLTVKGYKVVPRGDLWPLGQVGDILYHPEDVLPELGMMRHRLGTNMLKNIWMTENGEAIVWYYFDNETKTDVKKYENGLKGWADHTCIALKKLPPNDCNTNLGHPAVCVTGSAGCSSALGNTYDKYKITQIMRLAPYCDDSAVAHELGHTLGLNHEQGRSDADEFMHTIFANFYMSAGNIDEDKIRFFWLQAMKCSPEQVMTDPKPFDPMSIMMYGSSALSGGDRLPCFLHKNPHEHYMIDYHVPMYYREPKRFAQTYYDYYSVNVAYKCPVKWKTACEKNGKAPPKCANFGYITKECKCTCPAGFKGTTCGTKTGPMFPVLKKAKVMLDISKPGLVDLEGKGMIDQHYKHEAGFNLCQFITIVIRSNSDSRISVEVAPAFEKVAKVYIEKQGTFVDDQANDCDAVRVYEGDFKLGFSRAECLSALLNNEFPENRRIFRSKKDAMDIYGYTTPHVSPYFLPDIARKALEFRLNITFLMRAEDKLHLEKGGGFFGGRGANALALAYKTHSHIAIFVPVLLITLAGLATAAFVIYRRKKGKQAESDESPTVHGEETGSEESQTKRSSLESDDSHSSN